jgi:hypothetical protein
MVPVNSQFSIHLRKGLDGLLKPFGDDTFEEATAIVFI